MEVIFLQAFVTGAQNPTHSSEVFWEYTRICFPQRVTMKALGLPLAPLSPTPKSFTFLELKGRLGC